ncbi:nuclear transport factor 2 family protein [Massilia atriviolacea]|uniref:Nuclear transport factor 2 family protein n=1 Tax=Massilia atriviolacea TaxID=2495579 RepID=A0A430HPI3_9BURK|nr:nuclear transport factor 2 family protein [Massilia atriviolacea]RSZ59425.1 nuclear transport factor 2 family protein [Massilia atriviolacea]
MRQFVLLAVLGLASLQAWAATPAETLAAYHAALHAGDEARAMKLLSPEAVIYEAGHVERSRSEYADHHLANDIAFARATTRRVVRHKERLEGNLAILLDEVETRGAFKGKTINAVSTETAILEKKGDGWVVLHFHWSSRKAK